MDFESTTTRGAGGLDFTETDEGESYLQAA
jgi:hypothetical protein